MIREKQCNNPRARVLALIAAVALIAVALVPASQPVMAGGSGHNDTLSSAPVVAPALDTGATVEVSLTSVYKEDATFSLSEEMNSNLDVSILWNLMWLML